LDYTGWRKMEIPFDPAYWTEETYYTGYDANNPQSFDWTKLAYIKIGFWGTYYNPDAGYSVSAKLDDVRLLSLKEMTAPAGPGPGSGGDNTPGDTGCKNGCKNSTAGMIAATLAVALILLKRRSA